MFPSNLFHFRNQIWGKYLGLFGPELHKSEESFPPQSDWAGTWCWSAYRDHWDRQRQNSSWAYIIYDVLQATAKKSASNFVWAHRQLAMKFCRDFMWAQRCLKHGASAPVWAQVTAQEILLFISCGPRELPKK